MKIKISENAVKFVSPASPREVRSTAAKGLVPLSPRDVVKVLYILCHDKDPDVRRLAGETIRNYSAKIIDSVLSGDIEPPIIDYVVRNHTEGHRFVDRVLANRNTSDETLVWLASSSNASVVDALSINHERLLRSREVLNALINNPALKGALRESIMELADPTVRMRKSEDAAVEESPAQAEPAAASETADEPETKDEDDEEIDERNIGARINQMSVAEKIKYATRGNKEVRTILIKDSSKMVVAAVIKSPKITEEEILKVAQNKQSSDEAIRLVALNKEWLKNYAIRLALVHNPKTPPGVALRLMPYVTKKDLKDLAGSRNVSSIISTNARKLLAAKAKTS